jgi:hypothetical protein
MSQVHACPQMQLTIMQAVSLASVDKYAQPGRETVGFGRCEGLELQLVNCVLVHCWLGEF